MPFLPGIKRTLIPLASWGLLGMALVPVRLSSQSAHDSAGITIVQAASMREAPTVFRLDTAAPVIDVGGLASNPDDELTPMRVDVTGILLSDGRLVVADITRLRWYSPTGAPLFTRGRAGQGPREFRNLSGLCTAAVDTVVAFDPPNARFSVWSPAGDFVREVPVQRLGTVGPDACGSDGSVSVSLCSTSGPDGEQQHAWIRDLAGPTESRFPVAACDVLSGLRRESSIGRLGGSVVVGDAARGELRLYRHDGTLLRITRLSDPLEPFTDADREAWARRTVPTNASPERIRDAIERAKRRSFEPNWPAFDAIRIDPTTGYVWVQSYSRSRDDLVSWTAFSPDGRILGKLQLPARPRGTVFDVIAFRANRVVVRRSDADGAAHITVYSLIRGK